MRVPSRNVPFRLDKSRISQCPLPQRTRACCVETHGELTSNEQRGSRPTTVCGSSTLPCSVFLFLRVPTSPPKQLSSGALFRRTRAVGQDTSWVTRNLTISEYFKTVRG